MTQAEKFTVGQRVGIVRGVQSVDGPHVYMTGVVVRTVAPWGETEYVVKAEDGSELVYRAYLLRSLTEGNKTMTENRARYVVCVRPRMMTKWIEEMETNDLDAATREADSRFEDGNYDARVWDRAVGAFVAETDRF